MMGLNNEDSVDSSEIASENLNLHSHRGLIDKEKELDQYYEQQDENVENDSNRSDQIDDGTMNVFGFNDDLNLDDRVIIQNPTDNQIYNLVERPKYLLSFDLKDSEQEFLYTISKQEARKTTMYLALLVLLNKIVIFGDIL
jgi:hypothetical protein